MSESKEDQASRFVETEPKEFISFDAPDAPDIDAQRAAAGRLGYNEPSPEWNDFTAGWWVAMRGGHLEPDDTQPWRDGYHAYRA